jgi:hypothetical protein
MRKRICCAALLTAAFALFAAACENYSLRDYLADREMGSSVSNMPETATPAVLSDIVIKPSAVVPAVSFHLINENANPGDPPFETGSVWKVYTAASGLASGLGATASGNTLIL